MPRANFEVDIIKEGYFKGFFDGRNRREYDQGGGGWHKFGGADCFRQGYSLGYKRGSGKVESVGRLQETVRKYFYEDYQSFDEVIFRVERETVKK